MGRRFLHGLVGLAYGLLAGAVVTFAVVVARARLEKVYLHSVSELAGWIGSPVPLLALVGVGLAVSGRHRLAPAALGGLAGLVAGAAVGVALGALLSDDPAWAWAGGVIGAGVGLVAGFVGRAIRDVRDERTGLAAFVGLALLALAPQACHDPPPPLPEPGLHDEPDPARVESVVHLVGDPGVARRGTHPVLPAVRRDVERWSERLAPDGHVVVVVLGDIVYPAGVRPRESEGWSADSAVVADQVWMVGGPAARALGARGFFVAGNHDWGHQEDWEGTVRLMRLEELLDGWRGHGVDVSLEPEPGDAGPSVVDVGEHLRLLLLDTAWWLYAPDPWTRDRAVLGIQRALAGAGGRRTVVAAHHPLRSGGPHGALARLGSTLGLRTLLARSGALLQDLHSEPYRDLVGRLEAVFEAEGAPDVFAGGHEHSLQVLRGTGPAQPALDVVSGSASKLTRVQAVQETVWAVSAPGWIRLFVMDDGTLRVTVEAAPPAYLSCAGAPDVAACMAEGTDAFRTVWSGEVGRDEARP